MKRMQIYVCQQFRNHHVPSPPNIKRECNSSANNSGMSTLSVGLGLGECNNSTCVVVARLLRKNKQQTS
jgi:hypothetical protein